MAWEMPSRPSTKMEYSKTRLSFFMLNLVILQTLVLGEPQVPCLFIFGDSLVDNGNNNYLETVLKVNYFPYGIDFPAGPTGRFTNGRNIADFIAELLGFDKSIPPFANGTNQEILAGVNYGTGGAGILDETGSQFGDLVSLNEQLSNHEITISRIAELLGGQSAAKEHLSSCIYYVGMGTNDYIVTYLPQFYSSNTSFTPKQFAALLITHYSKQLRKLYDNGARKVAVFALGKLGCMPLQLAMYGSPNASSCVETANNVVQIFNENLQLLINDLNNRLPNAKFVYTRDISMTASNGNIKIFSEPCCQVGTIGRCVPGTAPCSNRDEYRFWDEVHPTEAAISIAANIAYNDMSPLYADPIDVW